MDLKIISERRVINFYLHTVTCAKFLPVNFRLSERAGVEVERFTGHVFGHDVGQPERLQRQFRPVD